MRWPIGIALVWSFTCGISGVRPATGADRRPTDRVEPDLVDQGEFLGCVRGSCGDRPVGMQVVALGQGAFEARWFEGGLPGKGEIEWPGVKLKGQRETEPGGRVVLMGDDGIRAEISGGRTDFRAPWGSGRLMRYHRSSPTLGLKPPEDAIVLFADGRANRLDRVKLAEDGSLLAGAVTTIPVGDFTMHAEFRTPFMPDARGQGRGNSGIYIQRRYEVQILDSFGLSGEANECGGLYRQRRPALNMCLPPLAWQTYDITFRAARWNASGTKTDDAELTVFHNGVAVHYHRPIPDKTGAGQPEGPNDLPIYFQDHGNPVTYRNVWIVTEIRSPSRPGTPRVCGRR